MHHSSFSSTTTTFVSFFLLHVFACASEQDDSLSGNDQAQQVVNIQERFSTCKANAPESVDLQAQDYWIATCMFDDHPEYLMTDEKKVYENCASQCGNQDSVCKGQCSLSASYAGKGRLEIERMKNLYCSAENPYLELDQQDIALGKYVVIRSFTTDNQEAMDYIFALKEYATFCGISYESVGGEVFDTVEEFCSASFTYENTYIFNYNTHCP